MKENSLSEDTLQENMGLHKDKFVKCKKKGSGFTTELSVEVVGSVIRAFLAVGKRVAK